MAVRWWHMLLAGTISIAAHAAGVALVSHLWEPTVPPQDGPEEVQLDVWALGMPEGATDLAEIAPLGLSDMPITKAISESPPASDPSAMVDPATPLRPFPDLPARSTTSEQVEDQPIPAEPMEPVEPSHASPVLTRPDLDLPQTSAESEAASEALPDSGFVMTSPEPASSGEALPSMPAERVRRPSASAANETRDEQAAAPFGSTIGAPPAENPQGSPLGAVGGTGDQPRLGLLSGSPDGTTDPRSLYAGQLCEIINDVARRRYPRQAQRLGLEGSVMVKISVASTGALESVTLADRAEVPTALARGAIKAVEEAAPYPSFPDELTDTTLTFILKVVYRLQ